jgi:hypothetical protein
MKNITKFIRDNAIGIAGLLGTGVSLFQGVKSDKNLFEKYNNYRNSLDSSAQANLDLAENLLKDKTEIAANKATLVDAVNNYTQAMKIAKNLNDPNLKQEAINAAAKKLEDTVKDISTQDISGFFTELLAQYQEFILTANPEQKLSVFNIILAVMLLNSAITVISILLGEKIISRFQFLERYPKIIKLLELRANVNKKFIKSVIVFHLLIILTGLIFHVTFLLYTFS